MSDCVIVIDNRKFRSELLCREVSTIDLSDNCYYRVGSNYFTPASFNAFLKTVKDDYLFFTRLIPLDNQEVKNLIDDSNYDP